MSVGYILARAGQKMGLNPGDPAQRLTLIGFLNEAAREIWMQSDPPGSVMEQAFKINGDQTIAMPWYVGRIRGFRELASMQAWHVNKLRPRYNQFNWKDMWRNYRLKDRQALMQSIDNQSQVVLTVPEEETVTYTTFSNPPTTGPVIVTITGSTINAQQVSEDIVMNEESVTSVNAYLDIFAVKKNVLYNQFDITLSQIDGKMLTVIPNNTNKAMYQIVDVSAAPWLPQNTSILDNFMECLYKRALPELWNDDDEFPANDYDDIVVSRIMKLWKEEEDKPELAAIYINKGNTLAAGLKQDQDMDTEDQVAFVANTHDTLLRRVGTGLRRRYSLYAGRKE